MAVNLIRTGVVPHVENLCVRLVHEDVVAVTATRDRQRTDSCLLNRTWRTGDTGLQAIRKSDGLQTTRGANTSNRRGITWQSARPRSAICRVFQSPPLRCHDRSIHELKFVLVPRLCDDLACLSVDGDRRRRGRCNGSTVCSRHNRSSRFSEADRGSRYGRCVYFWCRDS